MKIDLVTSCEDTPRGIWDTLKEHFEGKTISRKLFLMKASFGLKMHEGTTVRDHIRALKDLIDKLRAVDMKIEDEIYVCILLMSLTDNFMPLVTSLEARDEIPKLEFVIFLLEDFELKRQSEIQSTQESNANMVEGGKQNGQNGTIDGTFATLMSEKAQVAGAWIIDSGATSH